MATTPRTAKSIFLEAVEKYKPEQWAAFLDGMCRDNADLRARVEDLLKAHRESDSLLDQIDGTVDLPKGEVVLGTVIGNYKLLQQIGEGGFGVVFMAEQQQPVKRKVALKIIKPGMDTKAVIARFEAERQALAMMDHANIAKVFDGGATEHGRPYFVMELVKGVPVTEYCDTNELTTRERLKLFIIVCQAVQHAHQKGVIHRDLKPSNVLVTLADVEPVVKVIDFGVAKATNQQLTERTLFTTFGQMIGTPQYMSPEQAEMNCLDVDTRSDVYSLGVLLYELLTGSTPLEAKPLRTAGYAELQRMIREGEPPRPSTRLSSSGERLTAIAKHRRATPVKLKHQVRGDLDWVVMKSLEKDRKRRYESPSAFAKDVTAFLNGDPVDARRPTLGYRAVKYLNRNRFAIAIGVFMVASLSIGLISAVSQRNVARNALADVESGRKQMLASAMEQTTLLALQGELSTAQEKLAVARLLGADRGWCRLMEGQIAMHDGRYDDASVLLRQARKMLGDSTPAYSLSLICELYAGFEHEYLMRVGGLKNKPARTFEDYLFRGLGQTVANPDRAVKNLEEAIRRKPNNAIVHLHLANALRLLAADIVDHEIAYDVAKSATEEALVATKMLPKSPFAMAECIHANLVLANICDRLGNEYKSEAAACVEKARQAVIVSKSLKYDWMAHMARVYFHDQRGTAQQALGELFAPIPPNVKKRNGDIVYRRSWWHFCNNNLPEAIAEFNSQRGNGSQQDNLMLPAFISMTMASEKDLSKLKDKFAHRLDDPKRDKRGIFAHHDWAVGRLLQLDEIAQRRGRAFHAILKKLDHDFTDDLLPLASYMGGQTDFPRIGQRGGRPSNRVLVEANFALGVDSLAKGQRRKAQEYFRKCADTDYYEFVAHWWSRAFLKRLAEKDWLPWLPNDGSLTPITAR